MEEYVRQDYSTNVQDIVDQDHYDIRDEKFPKAEVSVDVYCCHQYLGLVQGKKYVSAENYQLQNDDSGKYLKMCEIVLTLEGANLQVKGEYYKLCELHAVQVVPVCQEAPGEGNWIPENADLEEADMVEEEKDEIAEMVKIVVYIDVEKNKDGLSGKGDVIDSMTQYLEVKEFHYQNNCIEDKEFVDHVQNNVLGYFLVDVY